jgi:hypothetical protein
MLGPLSREAGGGMMFAKATHCEKGLNLAKAGKTANEGLVNRRFEGSDVPRMSILRTLRGPLDFTPAEIARIRHDCSRSRS